MGKKRSRKHEYSELTRTMKLYDYSRHFLESNLQLMEALDKMAEPIKLYKTIVTVADEDKRNNYADLTSFGGFGTELLAWMMDRGDNDFYVIHDWCRDDDFGEVVFLDPKDLDDFHTEFMPMLAAKRSLGGLGPMYFMHPWPCRIEYEYYRDKGEAPADLWVVEVDWREWEWFDNPDGWVGMVPDPEGMVVWLQLRAIGFQKRFYVFDYEKKPSEFAFECEADMILFSAWLGDYRELKDNE